MGDFNAKIQNKLNDMETGTGKFTLNQTCLFVRALKWQVFFVFVVLGLKLCAPW